MYVLSENIKKKSFFFSMKFSILSSEKNLCILHGQVFIMTILFLMRFGHENITSSILLSLFQEEHLSFSTARNVHLLLVNCPLEALAYGQQCAYGNSDGPY